MRKFSKVLAIALVTLISVSHSEVNTADAGTVACYHQNIKENGTYLYTTYESHTFQTGGITYTCSVTINHSKVVTSCMDCGTVFDESFIQTKIHSNRICPLYGTQ